MGNLEFAQNATKQAYKTLYGLFVAEGMPRKKAREAARAVLPNMTTSPMVVTANHRAWRYVIKQRWHEAADAEIRELAGELLKQLRSIAPSTYQDIPDEPYPYAPEPPDEVAELRARIAELEAEATKWKNFDPFEEAE
jgi:thymidylate synthase (FAD)